MGRHEQKQARRLRRRQLAAEAEMVVEREGRELMNEAEMENVGGEMAVGEDIDGVDEMVWGEEDNIFVMEEDSSHDLEVDTNTSDSDEEDSEFSEGEEDQSWGDHDHRGSHNPLRY